MAREEPHQTSPSWWGVLAKRTAGFLVKLGKAERITEAGPGEKFRGPNGVASGKGQHLWHRRSCSSCPLSEQVTCKAGRGWQAPPQTGDRGCAQRGAPWGPGSVSEPRGALGPGTTGPCSPLNRGAWLERPLLAVPTTAPVLSWGRSAAVRHSNPLLHHVQQPDGVGKLEAGPHPATCESSGAPVRWQPFMPGCGRARRSGRENASLLSVSFFVFWGLPRKPLVCKAQIESLLDLKTPWWMVQHGAPSRVKRGLAVLGLPHQKGGSR